MRLPVRRILRCLFCGLHCQVAGKKGARGSQGAKSAPLLKAVPIAVRMLFAHSTATKGSLFIPKRIVVTALARAGGQGARQGRGKGVARERGGAGAEGGERVAASDAAESPSADTADLSADEDDSVYDPYDNFFTVAYSGAMCVSCTSPPFPPRTPTD